MAEKDDGVDKPDEAYKAKAHEANEAEADEANKAFATEEVNKAVEPMFWQVQQIDEAIDATANKTDEAIGAGVFVKAKAKEVIVVKEANAAN